MPNNSNSNNNSQRPGNKPGEMGEANRDARRADDETQRRNLEETERRARENGSKDPGRGPGNER